MLVLRNPSPAAPESTALAGVARRPVCTPGNRQRLLPRLSDGPDRPAEARLGRGTDPVDPAGHASRAGKGQRMATCAWLQKAYGKLSIAQHKAELTDSWPQGE